MNPRKLLLCSLLAACADDGATLVTQAPGDTTLDVIGLSERPASLLVVDHADPVARRRLERTLRAIGGELIAVHAPRLAIAQVPDGADPILADLGVAARFDRAVSEADLAGATPAEARFLAVYSNRWQAQVPPGLRITAREAADPLPEAAPRVALGPGPTPDPEDQVSIPYASGTVVVSVLLPESNGAIDPSTEDWTEEGIREVYLKLQAALDTIAAAEPNADLRFVLHYESAPAGAGLDGTIDSDYEFGQRAQWNDWANESLATAHVLGKVLDREVSPDQVWTAAMDYQLALRRAYDADAAFFVMVGANQNWTAGLRAHAFINGPWTVLSSDNGAEVFAHELGHIFGALDEYCADICNSPTSVQGYVGVYNANAEFREGDPWAGGINRGRGEAASSLMQYNAWGAINGYTRAAWGWIDADGDGVIDVRDTRPESELAASVEGQLVRLTGQVIDRPLPRQGGTPYSMNRIAGLEVELERDGAVVDVIEVELAGDTRGRQAVDVALPALPAGDWLLRIRARNQVGNLERDPLVLPVTIETAGDVAPRPHLDLGEPGPLSSGTRVAVHAAATSLDGDAAEVRIDLGGDGSFETGWAADHAIEATPVAGLWAIVVEARDVGAAAGVTRRIEVPVFAGNAPPRVELSAVPSLIHGTARAELELRATATDADGGDPELSWLARLATDDARFDLASGWGAAPAFGLALPTPEQLATTRIDLAAGDRWLARGQVRDLVALDATTFAVAGGTAGVWIVDVADPAAPEVIGRVELETIASDLHVDGDRLYVLGTGLSIVDISDRRDPREIDQLVATSGKRIATATEPQPIPEQTDWGASHGLMVEDGDRITSARVIVRIDHPRPAQLRIRLLPPKQEGLEPVVLRDHVAGPAGDRTYTFTRGNTPALRDLEGRFAADGWTVEVIDDVVDGQAGTLIASELRFETRSRAARVLPQANRIVGTLSTGDLVIGGAGLEAIDVTFPFWAIRLARISGTGTSGAVLFGDTVIASMPLESKRGGAAVLRGLVAVDFSIPFFPEVIRIEDELGVAPQEVSRIGDRLYVMMAPACDEPEERAAPGGGCDPTWYTSIADPAAFAAGSARWELGRTEHRIDPYAFGDDRSLWTVGNDGFVQELDVSDLGGFRVLRAYPQSWAARIVPLGDARDVLLFRYGVEAEVGNLDAVISTLSRTYRVAVEARDAAGAVARAYRTVHVIPYDHPPQVAEVYQQFGAVAGEPFGFHVVLTDPDQGKIWDPYLMVRADWDGDGRFDTDWYWTQNQPGTFLDLQWTYAAAGTYQAVIEVKDGYLASHRRVQEVVVQ